MNANLTRACFWGCLAVSGLVAGSAIAKSTTEDANPYSVISDKNVFHLNPAPVPTAEVVKPPDLPTVKLSGFQKVGSRMKVYLAIPGKDPKDTAYLALQAGEKERDVEIVTIRAEKQEVDIVNSGTPMTLTIASNGFQLTGGVIAKSDKAPPAPGLPGSRRAAAPPGLPAAPGGTPSSAGGRSSAIIMGGGGGSSSSFGSGVAASGPSTPYGGGATISGGSPAYSGAPPVAPGVASQVANTLLSSTPGQYRLPTPEVVAPPPPEVQAAVMLGQEAAGGPPSPVQVEEH